jgi:translation initiation factor 2B subunit (eIF-2B alpha/beta/delta family)
MPIKFHNQKTADDIIAVLKNDTISGSSEMVNSLIRHLLRIEKELSETEKEKISKKLNEYAHTVSHFAVCKHFAHALTSHSRWHPFLTDYLTRYQNINTLIAEQALTIIEPRSKIFLAHSNSNTVIDFFQHLSTFKIPVTIFQTTSSPGEEGIIQAERLRQLSFTVALVETLPSMEVLSTTDYFLTGADLITDEAIINKVGTRILAEQINLLNKPYYVLADARKFSAQKPVHLPSSFEFIPKKLITKIITGESVD